MRIFILSLFLFAATAFAYDCNAPVVDNANVLQGKIPQVTAALATITSKGGDPRVVTDDPSITPEQYVSTIQRSCPSWQSVNGGVKNNLIVFLVFPKHHKVGLFVGSEFGKAIDAGVIRSQFMAPAFRDGDWARGMISGINQVVVQIEAFQTAALHPATTVVTQQATDLSGLWKWLDALLLLAALIGVIVGFLYYRKRRSARIAAQQNAVHWRNEAAGKVTSTQYSAWTEEFSRLSNSETYNPDTKGLDTDQYVEMAARYKNICDKIDSITLTENLTYGKKKVTTYPPEEAKPAAGIAAKNIPSAPEQRTDIPAQATVQNTTIINEAPQRTIYDDDPLYAPIPVVIPIEEPVMVPDREEVREEPSSGFSDSSASSDTDDSSSSFSDSSSSSDFSSGSDSFSDSSSSSDFGGGGGDFSGGSDSF